MTRHLVGREPERAALAQRLAAALGGEGGIVLVAGEPGVGKTRLAEEAADRAREAGMACAVGRATEDEGSPPYWPFLQLFRSLDRRPPAEMDPRETMAVPDHRQRFQLFEAVTEILIGAAEPGGLLLVLDDLQWADAASLRLLVHLAMAVTPSRLVVVATYRDTETAGQESLRGALAALARESAVTRLRLAGLAEPEVAAQLAAIIGWAVPPSVATAVCRRTRGNPFFVGELGRRLASSVDGELPDGVRDAVRDRLGRLSAGCRAVISAAAVLGSDVDVSALAAATERDLDGILGALDEAIAAGIIDGSRFAHDLIRESARLDMPTADRLELHRRMAEHLATRGDADSRVGEVAFHWLESLPLGDAAQAVSWAERAATRAMAQLAWEEAANLYGHTLDTLTARGLGSPERRCELLLARARAQVNAFDVDGSRQSLLAAAGIARELGDAERLGQAVLTLEGVTDYLWDQIGRAMCTEALAGLPETDSGLRARLLALLVVCGSWQPPDVASALSVEAVAMAERVGDPRALREALRARQMVLSGPDGVADRLALGDRMLALGADGDDDATLWGRLWRFDALAQLGHLDRAESEVDLIGAVADRMRSPLAAWHAVRCRATIAAARGRLAEATELAQHALVTARRGGSEGSLFPSVGLIMMLRLQTGDLDDMPGELGQIDVDNPATASRRAILASWSLLAGDREEALQLYRGLPPPDALPPFVHLVALAATMELAAEFDDRETAADVYRRLTPYADLFVCGGAGVLIIMGPVRHPLGLAAVTMGRFDEGIHHLRAAIDISERTGMPPHVATATYQLARALVRRRRPGDQEEAAALAVSAAAQAGRLGMRPLHGAAQALADSLAGRGPGPLTRRETHVAELVSQGLTNRQIAAANHISERTVDSHVQHILSKLGFTSRAQIAAWVVGRRAPSTH